MADVAVLVGSLVVGDGALFLNGIANFGPDGISVAWETSVPWDSTPVAVNQACLAAAVAAGALLGFTVEPSDNKLIFAGAQTP